MGIRALEALGFLPLSATRTRAILTNSDDHQGYFCTAILSTLLANRINEVIKLLASVSRQMWVNVWLNTPRRSHEASGTSGMKASANGGLNLSILDG